jgi:hypothetical protein
MLPPTPARVWDIAQLDADLSAQEWAQRPVTQQMLRDAIASLSAGVTLFGGPMDGVTLGDTAWTSAVASAQAKGNKLVLPAGILQLSASPIWPAGLDIEGQGKDRTIIRVSGAVNGFNAADAGPGYALSGRLRGFTLQGAAGALCGINLNFRNMPKVEDVRVTGFAQQGAYFKNCLLSELDNCLFQANGGASFAQVEAELGTTFLWKHSYISGGNSGTIAGLAIDKLNGFTILGGAIESTGIPIRLCGKADATVGTNFGLIEGIDLENPSGTADCFIEMGAGWSGAAGQGVTRVSGWFTSSPSGTTTAKYGVKAQNTDTIYFGPSKIGIPSFASGGISNFELVGTSNFRWRLSPMSSNLGAGLIHVRENGAARPDALPYTSWEQGGRNVILTRATSFALNSATPDASGAALVGTNSSSGTTITNITGGRDGQVLMIFAGDSLTTLKHNNGGVGNIVLGAAADWKMAVGNIALLVYDVTTTSWREVLSPVGAVGPINGTANFLAATTSSGQQSLVATGTDANISMNLTPKGTGFVKSNISSQFGAHRVGAVAAGNWMDIFPNVAGSPPRLVADGADTDVDLKLEPKGAGMVNINLPATIANGGGAAPTVGTIGGSGPTAAAQTGWLKVKVNGAVRYIPVWA